MDPVEGLRALGLTQYEAAVYSHLLSHGPMDARQLSRGANVPSGRIYDALHALAERGAVEIVQGRPKRFAAQPPAVALSELLQRRRVELDHTFDEICRTAAQLEQALTPRMREEARPVLKVSLGEETGHAFLAAQVARARERIDAVLRVDVELQDRDVEVFRGLAQAVARGVTVRVIVPPEDLERAIASPFAMKVLEVLGPLLGAGLDVRLSEAASSPFTVIDCEAVTLPVKNPLRPDRYFAFLFVHDPPFALDLARKFEELWESADAGVTDALAAAERVAEKFEP